MTKFLEMSDSLQTSTEILAAILRLAGGNKELAMQIWEDAGRAETAEIQGDLIERGLDPTEMVWGVSGTGWVSYC
jgi:hypothetical protein